MKDSVIEIPSDEEFATYHEKCFKELPKKILLKAVEVLKNDFSEEDKKFLINLYNNTPASRKALWFIDHHFYDGMDIRNLLRKNRLFDKKLPSKNWDDYYVLCMECAIGVREF
jgi:hypothetical protein